MSQNLCFSSASSTTQGAERELPGLAHGLAYLLARGGAAGPSGAAVGKGRPQSQVGQEGWPGKVSGRAQLTTVGEMNLFQAVGCQPDPSLEWRAEHDRAGQTA